MFSCRFECVVTKQLLMFRVVCIFFSIADFVSNKDIYIYN